MTVESCIDIGGAPGGPAMLFLHGGSLNRRMWQPQVEMLAEDFRVIAADLPGHGAMRDGRFDLYAAAKYVAGVLEAQDAVPALLIGLSLGGYVAMVHAAERTDQVSGLVLSGCSVDYGGLLGIAAKANAAVLKLMTQERFAAKQEHRLRRAYPDSVVDSMVELGFSLRGGVDSLRQVVATDFHPVLRRYQGPVLILNGANDCLSRKGAAGLAGSVGAEYRVIPDAGHICNLDQPAAFTAEVSRFAKSVGFPPARR